MGTWWSYVRTMEPARVRAVAVAALALAAALGLTRATELPAWADAAVALVAALLPLVQGEATRAAVVPVAAHEAVLDAAQHGADESSDPHDGVGAIPGED